MSEIKEIIVDYNYAAFSMTSSGIYMPLISEFDLLLMQQIMQQANNHFNDNKQHVTDDHGNHIIK
jgi:hypothetical protein